MSRRRIMTNEYAADGTGRPLGATCPWSLPARELTRSATPARRIDGCD